MPLSRRTPLCEHLIGWTSVSADDNDFYHADMLKFRNAGTLGGTVIIKMTDASSISYRLVRVAG